MYRTRGHITKITLLQRQVMDTGTMKEPGIKMTSDYLRGREYTNVLPLETEEPEARNTATITDGKLREPTSDDTGSAETLSERGLGKGKTPIPRGSKQDDTSLNEDGSTAPPGTLPFAA
jgi:hypothetical protein